VLNPSSNNMQTTHCKLSALLVLSLVPHAAVAQVDESIKRQQVCQVGDGETCKDSFGLLDEELSLLQQQMLVSEHTGSNSNDINNLVQAAISMYKAHGGKVTPEVQTFLQKVVDTIDTVLGKIITAHEIDSGAVNDTYSNILDTEDALKNDLAANAESLKLVKGARTKMNDCRGEESKQRLIHEECLRELSLQILRLGISDKKTFNNIVPSLPEDVQDELHEAINEFGTNEEQIKRLTKQLHNCGRAAMLAQTAKCDALQSDDFEAKACTYANSMSTMCSDLKSNWPAAKAAYDNKVQNVEKLEADRVVEWTGLTRARCVLKALHDNVADLDAAIKECYKTVVTTKVLKVFYWPARTIPDCPETPPYPCTAEFINNEYLNMPNGTFAATCTACTGAAATEDASL